MEDASVGEDKEGTSDDEYEEGTGQVLFDEGGGRTAGCYVEYFLTFVQEVGEKGQFSEELSLSFLYSGLVDILVIGEEGISVSGKVYRMLTILVD